MVGPAAFTREAGYGSGVYVTVQNAQGALEHWPSERFQNAMRMQQFHPQAQVSLDNGATWLPAGTVFQRLNLRGDDGMALLVPGRTEAWCTTAGYVALFSLLFFGGPVVVGTTAIAFDDGPKLGVRLGAVLVGLLLGPAPIALCAWLGFRGLKKDPTLRGRGRAIFALIIAALLVLPCIAGLFGAFLA